MNPPKAIIASTGRSGSGYIAKVLQAYGIDAGHESYYNFPWQGRAQVAIDSSWLSIAHLSEFEGIIFHQVRNPLHVLTSLMNTYEKDTKHSQKYFPFREEMMPYRTGDLQRDFMSMIWWMNEEIEKHRTTGWNVEKVTPKTIENVCLHCGYNYSYAKAKKAIDSVSKTYNSHHDSDYLSWGDIPYCEEKKKLMEQAEKYGYKVPKINHNH